MKNSQIQTEQIGKVSASVDQNLVIVLIQEFYVYSDVQLLCSMNSFLVSAKAVIDVSVNSLGYLHQTNILPEMSVIHLRNKGN